MFILHYANLKNAPQLFLVSLKYSCTRDNGNRGITHEIMQYSPTYFSHDIHKIILFFCSSKSIVRVREEVSELHIENNTIRKEKILRGGDHWTMRSLYITVIFVLKSYIKFKQSWHSRLSSSVPWSLQLPPIDSNPGVYKKRCSYVVE